MASGRATTRYVRTATGEADAPPEPPRSHRIRFPRPRFRHADRTPWHHVEQMGRHGPCLWAERARRAADVGGRHGFRRARRRAAGAGTHRCAWDLRLSGREYALSRCDPLVDADPPPLADRA